MNGKNQRLLTEILSESYKISSGLSEIATKCKRPHYKLQMWALRYLLIYVATFLPCSIKRK